MEGLASSARSCLLDACDDEEKPTPAIALNASQNRQELVNHLPCLAGHIKGMQTAFPGSFAAASIALRVHAASLTSDVDSTSCLFFKLKYKHGAGDAEHVPGCIGGHCGHGPVTNLLRCWLWLANSCISVEPQRFPKSSQTLHIMQIKYDSRGCSQRAPVTPKASCIFCTSKPENCE